MMEAIVCNGRNNIPYMPNLSIVTLLTFVNFLYDMVTLKSCKAGLNLGMLTANNNNEHESAVKVIYLWGQ